MISFEFTSVVALFFPPPLPCYTSSLFLLLLLLNFSLSCTILERAVATLIIIIIIGKWVGLAAVGPAICKKEKIYFYYLYIFFLLHRAGLGFLCPVTGCRFSFFHSPRRSRG